jgi:hypothetical protein
MCCDVEQLGVFWRGSCFRKARALDSVVGVCRQPGTECTEEHLHK